MDDSKSSNSDSSKDKENKEDIKTSKKNVVRDQSPPQKDEEKKEENNFILQYSPRTEYSVKLEEEEEMYSELKQNFVPITIKIIKKHFKERLGALKKEEMVAILKNHLLGFLPDHPDREKIMVRLLSRLFGDIDLNDNGDLEWNEFTNYIIHLGGSGDKSKSNVAYRLKFYSKSERNINPLELSDQVVYAFYIEKHNVLGTVEENKSVVKFFDGKTCKRLKTSIDLKDIQQSVDLVEFSKLNEKANRNLIKEEEDKKIKQNMLERGRSNLFGSTKSFEPGVKTLRTGGRRSGLAPNKKDGQVLMKFRKKHREEQKGIIDNFQILDKFDVNIRNQNKKLSVLCTCFIPEYDLLMISSTNNTITAWKYTRTEIKNVNVTTEYRLSKDELKIAILIANSPQCTMVWEPQQRCLFTGQKDGKILKWDLTNPNPLYDDTLNITSVIDKIGKLNMNKKDNSNKEETKKLLQQLKEKSTRFKDTLTNPFLIDEKNKNLTVSCLLILKKLQLLAASYYNGYVILWDTILKEYRKCYFDQNTGIYSMAYDSIRNLLFTCGFNHDIYVYDPYIDGASIYKLSGHSCSINSIDTNEKESELITLDILGNIKIWDTSGLINFQTLKINEEVEETGKKTHQENNTKKKKLSSSLRMVYLRKLKKIFIYGSKLLFFETDRSNSPDLADDQVICSCYYDKTTKNLLSFCLKKIKFWNLLTGKVRQIYDDPMGAEMTAIAVDKPCKRAYMGDNTGKLKNINLKNGTLLKELEPHNTEIKFLIHSMELNLIATCSIDNVIKIHDDHELLESEVIKELKIPDFNVRALCLINRFSRLGIGLSNGVVKFYDIEHFHYDSDLESDSSQFTDEVSAIDQIEEIELVLCCYSSGLCKFIVTPPSTAKFNTIYEFNNSKKGFPISISCLEFDTNLHHVFIGDMLGNINCYDISSIYEIMEEITTKEEGRNFENETIITKENIHLFNDLSIKHLWAVEAHKESIRHIHYIDITPRIIITTSHDLRIKIFCADDGKYKDEFKQIANRIKPVPIGIKYFLLDPFGEDDITGEPLYFVRKDILNFNPSQNQDGGNNQQIAEVAKKITEYNAKEKLWLACRNTNLPENMSNDWKLDIDIEKMQEKEEEEYQEMLEEVAEIEKITNATELILQSRSIYSEAYRPKYIEELNDIEKIKELSQVIQDRLRNVKLAVSKANLNQSKMVDLTKKKKETTKNTTDKNNNNASSLANKKKFGGKLAPIVLNKSKSAVDVFTNNTKKDNTTINNTSVGNENNNVSKSNINNANTINQQLQQTQQQQITQQENDQNKTNINDITNISGLKKNLLPKKFEKHFLPEIKSRYAISKVKLVTPGDMFNKLQGDFAQGFKELFMPIKILFKKTKEPKKQILRSRSTVILPGFNNKKPMDIEEEQEKMRIERMQHKKNITILEKYLRQLEQNAS